MKDWCTQKKHSRIVLAAIRVITLLASVLVLPVFAANENVIVSKCKEVGILILYMLKQMQINQQVLYNTLSF